MIIGVSYLVYKYGGPTAVYERADEFVHFPEVTTPVDPIEKLTEGTSEAERQSSLFEERLIVRTDRITGVVSVATQIAGAVTRTLFLLWPISQRFNRS